MITQFLTLNQNTSTKNWNSNDFSVKFSKTSCRRISAARHNRAHSYPYGKNKSNEIRKKQLFSTSPGQWTFHALSLPALARQLKFPPVCKSATSGPSDTPQNINFQKWPKTLKELTFSKTGEIPPVLAGRWLSSPMLEAFRLPQNSDLENLFVLECPFPLMKWSNIDEYTSRFSPFQIFVFRNFKGL